MAVDVTSIREIEPWTVRACLATILGASTFLWSVIWSLMWLATK